MQKKRILLKNKHFRTIKLILNRLEMVEVMSMCPSMHLVLQDITLVIEGRESQFVAADAKHFVMVAADQVHCSSCDCLVQQHISVGGVAKLPANDTFLDSFGCFLFFSINQQRIHFRTKTNKLLDWLACSFILHLSNNLKQKFLKVTTFNQKIV